MLVADRSEEHGEDCRSGAPTANVSETGNIGIVHCHECWKYTDDMRRDGDLVHEAVAVIVNAGTLAVEKSAAFTAADAFLARKFNAAGYSKDVVAATKVDPWKL